MDSALDAVTARANADSHTYHTVSEISQTESLPAHTFTGKTFAGSLEAGEAYICRYFSKHLSSFVYLNYINSECMGVLIQSDQ